MARTSLEATLRPSQGIVIVDLAGEINAAAQDSLNAAYAEAEGQAPQAIVLNFSRVEYINSTGIALIVSLLARARRSGRRLVVYGLSNHYQEVFRITHLADFIGIYPDEGSALAHVGASEA